MVVEEEDTTREVKRLWSTLSMPMKQIEVSIVSAMSVFGIVDHVGHLDGEVGGFGGGETLCLVGIVNGEVGPQSQNSCW